MLTRLGVRRLSATAKTVADLAAHLRVRSNPFIAFSESQFTLTASTPMREAAEHIEANRLTFATLVDATSAEPKKVVGMISERDILRYLTRASDVAFFSGRTAGEEPVAHHMTKREDMTTVRLDDTLEHTLSLSREIIWRHLPVLDYWDQFYGVLHIRDVVMDIVGPGGGSFWTGKSAIDILQLKRKQKLQTSDGQADSMSVEWQAQLNDYLLAKAARHTIAVDATVEEAAWKLFNERLTFLSVVDPAETRVVGIVNERAFLQYCAQPTRTHRGGADSVGSILTPLEYVLHVSLTDSAERCIELFFTHNVRHLPVIDRKGHLLGIISIRDVLQPLLPAKGDPAWSL